MTVDFVIWTSLFLFFAFIGFATKDFLKNGISTFNLTIMSIAFFAWLGVFKYGYLEKDFRGEFEPGIVLRTFFIVFISHLIIIVVFFKARKIAKFDKNVIINRPNFKSGTPFVLYTIFCLFVGSFIDPSGGWQTLIKGILQGISLGALAWAIFLKKKKASAIITILLVLELILSDYTSRRFVIALFVPIIYMWSLGVKSKLSFSSRKFNFIVSIVFIVTFFFLVSMRANHDFGEGYIHGAHLQNSVTMTLRLRNVDTFWNTAFIVDKFGDQFDYYFGSTYLSTLVALVPRSIWPDKPVSLGAPLGYMVRTGSQDFSLEGWHEINQFSLSPGFAGEAFANFGLFGCIFIPIVIGKFLRIVYEKVKFIKSPRQAHYIALVPIFITIFRGDFYSAINFSVFLYIGMFIFNRYIVRIRV